MGIAEIVALATVGMQIWQMVGEQKAKLSPEEIAAVDAQIKQIQASVPGKYDIPKEG